MNRILLFAALALASGLHAGVAASQAYKCVENGKTTISTAPCPAGAITRAEIAAEALPDADAARAEEERLQRHVDNMARERQARDAAHAAEQKAKAEQAALEARVEREKAEAESLRANVERRDIIYDAPLYGGIYGYGRYGGNFRGYGVRRSNIRPGLSVHIEANTGNAPARRGSAGRGGGAALGGRITMGSPRCFRDRDCYVQCPKTAVMGKFTESTPCRSDFT